MLDIPLGLALTEERARAIYAQGEEAVVFALLTQAKMLVEQQSSAAGTSHQTCKPLENQRQHLHNKYNGCFTFGPPPAHFSTATDSLS